MNKYSRTEVQDEDKAKRTISTLLVPSKYLDYYHNQSNFHGNLSSYFRYLLIQFGSQVNQYENMLTMDRTSKWKTCYQDAGLFLERKNFRPDPENWEQLRHIADSFGISMCYLFIFLMELEMYGLDSSISKSRKMYKSEYSSKIKSKSYFPVENSWNSIKHISENKKSQYLCSRIVKNSPKMLLRKLVLL